MGLLNLKTDIYKPSASQCFFFGVVFGIGVGIFLVPPSIINRKPYFSNLLDMEKQAKTEMTLDVVLSKGGTESATTATDDLAMEVKVLCLILTSPDNHETKAKHVKATWGKRCTYLLFMSTKSDPELGSIELPVEEGRENLWGKTKESFKYVYKNYFGKADWFFKADDDTYTIMENMRAMLYNENSSEPIYFGCRFKPLVKQGYMSGGAGYVLSKEALRRFINESVSNPDKCKQVNKGDEDVEIGKCLEAVGVKAGDSRDLKGRHRFLPFLPSRFLSSDVAKNHWIWKYTYYPITQGEQCCSDEIISMHYVDRTTMYLLEYFTYHVKKKTLN